MTTAGWPDPDLNLAECSDNTYGLLQVLNSTIQNTREIRLAFDRSEGTFHKKFFEITTITSNLSRQSEIFAHFLCFQASLHVHLGRSTVCKKISFNLPSSIMIHMMVLPLLQELLQNVQTFISCLHFFFLNLSGDKLAYTYSTL